MYNIIYNIVLLKYDPSKRIMNKNVIITIHHGYSKTDAGITLKLGTERPLWS